MLAAAMWKVDEAPQDILVGSKLDECSSMRSDALLVRCVGGQCRRRPRKSCNEDCEVPERKQVLHVRHTAEVSVPSLELGLQ